MAAGFENLQGHLLTHAIGADGRLHNPCPPVSLSHVVHIGWLSLLPGMLWLHFRNQTKVSSSIIPSLNSPRPSSQMLPHIRAKGSFSPSVIER